MEKQTQIINSKEPVYESPLEEAIEAKKDIDMLPRDIQILNIQPDDGKDPVLPEEYCYSFKKYPKYIFEEIQKCVINLYLPSGQDWLKENAYAYVVAKDGSHPYQDMISLGKITDNELLSSYSLENIKLVNRIPGKDNQYLFSISFTASIKNTYDAYMDFEVLLFATVSKNTAGTNIQYIIQSVSFTTRIEGGGVVL